MGEIQEPDDPIAPGMLLTDALVLLDQLALRTAGMPVAELPRWHSGNAWKLRAKNTPRELQQLAVAQVRSRQRFSAEPMLSPRACCRWFVRSRRLVCLPRKHHARVE